MTMMRTLPFTLLVFLSVLGTSAPSLAVIDQSTMLLTGGIWKLLSIPYDLGSIPFREITKARYDDYEKATNSNPASSCPRSFDILKDRAFRERSITVSWYDFNLHQFVEEIQQTEEIDENRRFSFNNEKSEFASIANLQMGVCWGHASLSRKFHILATFHPTLSDDESKLIGRQGKDRFYKTHIRHIINGHATDIPGYSNLSEFTADADIQTLMKKMVLKEWRRKSVDWKGLNVFARVIHKQTTTPEKAKTFVDQLEKKLSLHQNPLVFFAHSDPDRAGYIHIVETYRLIRESDGNVKMCFLDSHGTASDHTACGKYVLIRPDGSLLYRDWITPDDGLVYSNLKVIDFTPDEQYEEVRFVDELVKSCQSSN